MKLKGRGESKGLVFNVNIVPIVDALTILITFMLASGVYISIAVLDVGVTGASDGAASQSKSTDKVDIALRVTPDRTIALDVSGVRDESQVFPSSNGRLDLTGVGSALKSVKRRFPKVKTVTLFAHPVVKYQEVVSTMERVRRSHPEVLLGGF